MQLRAPSSFIFFIAFSLIAVFFVLLYLNFNRPVFGQVFARQFYEPINIHHEKPESASVFSACSLSVSCQAGIHLYSENIDVMGLCNIGQQDTSEYKYIVDGKTYAVRRYTFFDGLHCDEKPSSAYYFPLMPSWSLISTEPPPPLHWDRFLHSTYGIVALLSAYVLYGIKLFFFSKAAAVAIKQDIEDHQKQYALLAGFILPFIITLAFLHIHALSHQWWPLCFSPSFILFWIALKDMKSTKYKYILLLLLLLALGVFYVLVTLILTHLLTAFA